MAKRAVTSPATPGTEATHAQAFIDGVLPRLGESQRALLTRARTLLDRKSADDPRINACAACGAEAVGVLEALGMDAETLAAALLLPAYERGAVDGEAIEKSLGEAVLRLLQGAGRIAALKDLRKAAVEIVQADRLRRMLLTIAEDPRAVLILLAQQLCELRAVKGASDEVRRTLGEETLEVFAPLANRLGVWQLKWELEDLAFRFTDPNTYHRIASQLEDRRTEREAFIARVKDEIEREIKRAGLHAVVTGRPKHIYSIWKKMRRKDVDLSGIFDVLGLRILVDEVADCYAVLGLVHSLWTPIASEFDDYIAKPKASSYQSLHTAVIGPEGKTVEIQIRTHAMHRDADIGVAAHWRYKEGAGNRLAWSRRFLENAATERAISDLIERFRSVAFHERIYVLTPQARIIDLPLGATALDFAYAVHTDIGHRCRGAKADGIMIPLTQPLASGQQVEILTAREGGPSRDWLNPQLGYLKTNSARAKVRRWFREQDRAQHIVHGRSVLERERRRIAAGDVSLAELTKLLHFKDPDDLLAALGRNDITAVQLAQALGAHAPAPAPTPATPAALPARPAAAAQLLVSGVSNMMTRIARCCRPVPGEAVGGYITIGQGVSIHRQSCPNFVRLSETRAERIVEASWGSAPGKSYPVDIEVDAIDRRNLLHDVTDAVGGEKVDIVAVNTWSNKAKGSAHMTFTVMVENAAQLERVIRRIGNVRDVRFARRRQ